MFFGLILQGVTLVIVSLLFWEWRSGMSALASAYGGGVALVNTGMLVWRWYQGLRDFHCDGTRHLRAFYRSGLERFFVVGILLATGIAGLHLEPPPLLTGFIAGQIAWTFMAAFRKFE